MDEECTKSFVRIAHLEHGGLSTMQCLCVMLGYTGKYAVHSRGNNNSLTP